MENQQSIYFINNKVKVEYSQNLTQEIQFTNNRKIVFVYDAVGVKLEKETCDNSTTPTGRKDYIGGIEYNKNVLEAIYTDEGRTMPNGTVYYYEYTIKDLAYCSSSRHLGNSRVMFSDIDNDGIVTESEIIQEDHYYPFGMRHEGYGRTITSQGQNFYQYNGKELNENFGLDWYSYGFRNYDAAIGRFPSCDPIAEEFAFVSPYNYAENKVPNAIDLWGLQAYVVSEVYDKKGNLSSINVATHTNSAGERLNNGKSTLTNGTAMKDVLVYTYKYNDKGEKVRTESTTNKLSKKQAFTYKNGKKSKQKSNGFKTSEGFDELNDNDVNLNQSKGYFRQEGQTKTSSNNSIDVDDLTSAIKKKMSGDDIAISATLVYTDESQNSDKTSDVAKVKRVFPKLFAGGVKVKPNAFENSFDNGVQIWKKKKNAKGLQIEVFSKTKKK